MTVGRRTNVGLPFPTNTGLQTKSTMSQGGSDAYQMLPRSMLAVRNPLVILDWSTNAYHSADLGLDLPRIAFTNHYRRGLDRGIDLSVGVVFAGLARW